MSSNPSLAAAAIQLSEAAARQGSPERAAARSLLAILSQVDGQAVRLEADEAGSAVVPGLVVDLLREVCTTLERGDGIVASEVSRELTTSEAARVLGVSRPTLIALLDKKEIESRRVGTHRRVALSDLLSYRSRRVQQQREAYESLMAEQDELGILE
jgi:excisionase family DNA binding protein